MHNFQEQSDSTPQRGVPSGKRITKIFKRIIWVAGLILAMSVAPLWAQGGHRGDRLDSVLRDALATKSTAKMDVIIRAAESKRGQLRDTLRFRGSKFRREFLRTNAVHAQVTPAELKWLSKQPWVKSP